MAVLATKTVWEVELVLNADTGELEATPVPVEVEDWEGFEEFMPCDCDDL